ncbi:hypothetical protein V1279_001603 [Bradyrhizobium sp. AZCC 1610]
MQTSGAMRREIAKLYRRMGGAKRYPSPHAPALMGIAALHPSYGTALAMTRRELCHTGSAIEYFTWLSAKLDSIEAIPSSRVSLFFRNAS